MSQGDCFRGLILPKGKTKRKNEILFIDARNLGYLINRRTRDLSADDISKISDTYHNWLKQDETYQDIKGFCKSVSLEEVASKDYVLTPGRYVGLEEAEDDFDFIETFTKLQNELKQQMADEAKLNERILANLAKINLNTNQKNL